MRYSLLKKWFFVLLCVFVSPLLSATAEASERPGALLALQDSEDSEDSEVDVWSPPAESSPVTPAVTRSAEMSWYKRYRAMRAVTVGGVSFLAVGGAMLFAGGAGLATFRDDFGGALVSLLSITGGTIFALIGTPLALAGGFKLKDLAAQRGAMFSRSLGTATIVLEVTGAFFIVLASVGSYLTAVFLVTAGVLGAAGVVSGIAFGAQALRNSRRVAGARPVAIAPMVLRHGQRVSLAGARLSFTF